MKQLGIACRLMLYPTACVNPVAPVPDKNLNRT
jgi:hypothetical protein